MFYLMLFENETSSMFNQKCPYDFVNLGSPTSLGSLTSLHKFAICDEIDKQSGPLLCKWTSACTLDHHQPAVTTSRVPRCASTSDVSYARYDGDMLNRLLAESEARRLAFKIKKKQLVPMQIWLYTKSMLEI